MADRPVRRLGQMERMEGVDAGYLYMETPSMHMHTLKIAVIEPREPFTCERLEAELLARLDRLPPMQRRILPVPWQLNHPLWVTDQPVDPANHLAHHVLPDPGGMAELERQIGEVASAPLNRALPLWQLHVFEGMGENRVAVVAKLHHALADGAAANALLANMTDQAAEATSRPADGSPDWALEPTPSRGRQVRLAVTDATRQAFTLPRLLWHTGRALAAVVRHKRASQVATPRPLLDPPRTPFNGPLTPRRVFATCTLSLEELKEARAHHDGVTLNDVVLAVVAGALRSWLSARGELPDAPLVAGVPVATDRPDAPRRLAGNRVSNLFTSLATDVADPHERLATISRVTAEAKAVQRTLGPDMLVDWVQFSPPGPLSAAVRAYSKRRTAARHRPPFNVVVSNVRGPSEEVRIADARLTDLFSVGPILEGIGLNVTAWSYVDRLNVSLLSCPDLVPDLASLAAALRPALDELRKPRG